MHQTLSTLTAAKVWPASMKLSFDYFGMHPDDFVRPDGLVERQVCGDTRMRPGAPLCWNDIFFAETAPKGTVRAGPQPAQPTAQPTPPPDQQPQAQPTAAPPPAPAPAQAKPQPPA